MKKKNPEMVVGIFVVLGILFFAWMTIKIEKIQIKDRGILFSTSFESATGLDRASPVRVAGIHVGNVESLTLEEGRAKVAYSIPKNIALYRDAKAFIRSEGFLGEKYIEILPGTPGQPKLEPNTAIAQGAPPVDIEQFLTQIGALREDIQEVTRPLGEVIRSVDAKKVEGILSNLNTFSGQLTGLGKDAGKTIQKASEALSRIEEVGTKLTRGEGTLGKLIADESVYQEAKRTIETAKETVDTVKNAADSFRNIAERIDRGEGTLGKLVTDESLYREAKETIQSAKQTMESASEALKSVREIATKVEKGEGTLGKLVNDDTLVKEAEKTLKKVQKASESIEEQAPITVLGTIIGIFF